MSTDAPSPTPKSMDIELGDEPPHKNQVVLRGRNRGLIATVSLCMLSYVRYERSNILQVAEGYFAYADITTKRMVEILHCMGLLATWNGSASS